MTVATIEPDRFIAGDTVSWTRSFADYPANAGWSLSYVLMGSNKYTVNATTSGADFLVTITAAISAAYVAGYYAWQAYVTKGVERYTVGNGELTIEASLSALTGVYDGRSHAKKALEAIEAVIENRASVDQQEYEIAGRRLVRCKLPELLVFRDRYRAEVKNEERAAAMAKGLYVSNKLYVRM